MSSSTGGSSNHDNNNDFSFEPNAVIVKSTAGGKKKQWSLNARQVLKEDDTTFVHVRTKLSNVQRMLAAYIDVDPKKAHGIFEKTDVCQQLTKIKNLKIRQSLVKSDEEHAEQKRSPRQGEQEEGGRVRKAGLGRVDGIELCYDRNDRDFKDLIEKYHEEQQGRCNCKLCRK